MIRRGKMAVLWLSFFAMLAIAQSLQAQEATSKKSDAEWKVRDTIEWRFISTRFIHGEARPHIDTSLYELAINSVTGDTVFGVFRHVASKETTSVVDVIGLADEKRINVSYPNWFDNAVAEISFLSSTLKILSVEPAAPTRSSVEFNTHREVPHSDAQLLDYTRTEMRWFWSTLCPSVPDSVLRSHGREITDVVIKMDTTSRYSTSASGAQPERQIISDTITKHWIVQDVPRTKLESLKEVSVRSRSSRSNVEFFSVHRYDHVKMPPSVPIYFNGTSTNFGQPGTLKIEIEAYKRHN